jgi:prepilin-type N-terminal cleavage/methylation domain-containing protein
MSLHSPQSGFSLTELMVVVGIGSIFALAMVSIMSWTAMNQSRAVTLAKLEVVKENLQRTLGNDQAWQNTLEMGALPQSQSNMACLGNLTKCNPGSYPFTLYNGRVRPNPSTQLTAQDIVFDSTNLNAGFDMQGQACNQFSMAGNDACPFRYDLRWSPVCPAGVPCVNPQVMITAKLLYKPSGLKPPANWVNFSSERYSINNYYLSTPCLAKSVVFTNPNQSGNFQVPPNYHYMFVELWGAGGGGAAANANWAAGCCFNPGRDGQPTSFGSQSATFGPGGKTQVAGGVHVFNGVWCWGLVQQFWPDCNGTSGTQAGGPGATPAPTPPNSIPPGQACSVKVTSTSGNGGQSASQPGSPGGGGGAGSPGAWSGILVGGNCWAVQIVAQTNGGAGAVDPANPPFDAGYSAQAYTPTGVGGTTKLIGGASVPITVGQGGAGGSCWAANGGKGANGLVKITYW